MSLIFILFSSLLTLAFSATGVDVHDVYSSSSWECLLLYGIDFMVARAWHSTGTYDSAGATNVQNAQYAGFSNTAVYMFPCRGKNATDQMESLINNLGGTPYKMIWIDIEENTSDGCEWTQGTQQSNCNFILDLISTGANKGKKIGIYSSKTQWGENVFFGNVSACPEAAGITELWYAHWDNKQSFSDYSSQEFGGWTSPNMKQYTNSCYYCSFNADMDWY